MIAYSKEGLKTLTTDSALATIRESFGRVVYTHKTHQKMIDQL